MVRFFAQGAREPLMFFFVFPLLLGSSARESGGRIDPARAFAGMAGLRNLGPDIMESWFCIVGKILKARGGV